MAYKLVISAAVIFSATVIFFDDAGKPCSYTARLKADRLATSAELDGALKATPVFTDFLAARNLQLVGWTGDSPLVDDAGNTAPIGPEALAAFLALAGVPSVVFEAYIAASSAQAKLGN